MGRIASPLLLVVIMLLTCGVYFPGLNGGFVFDDSVNITKNAQIKITALDLNSLASAAHSSSSGLLQRPISMMSFALNYYAAGINPYYFKITNLVIHLFNGVGLYVLTWLLLNFYRKRFEPGLPVSHAQWVSLAVSALWLLHPFNLTSVLYVVQRMTSLSAFFSIWGLVIFFGGRIRLYEGKNGMSLIMAGLLLFAPLAALSKENGVLLPLFMLVAEFTLFTLYTGERVSRRYLVGFYLLFIAVPAIMVLGYFLLHLDWLLAGYKTRNFTLSERLMTEARVIWFYLGQIILPSNAQMGLYHDDIEISKGWLQPISTAIAVLGIILLAVIAFIARKRIPLVAFGALFFLAGHMLESTFVPLEIAHEHRNYLPMYGILLVLYFYLLYPLKQSSNLRLRQVVVILLIGLFSFNTFARSSKWSNLFDLFQAEVMHHPNSALANGEIGSIYANAFSFDPDAMDRSYNDAREHFEKAAGLDLSDTKALFGLIMLDMNRGKVVERAWVDELALRLEAAPYAAITSDKLVALTDCQLDGNCKLENVYLKNLIDSALRNPTLAGANRAKVLYALSSYTIKVDGDYLVALDIMRKMVQAAPLEPVYRSVIIKLLLILRRFDDAKAELALMERLDTSHEYQKEIAAQKEVLYGQKMYQPSH